MKRNFLFALAFLSLSQVTAVVAADSGQSWSPDAAPVVYVMRKMKQSNTYEGRNVMGEGMDVLLDDQGNPKEYKVIDYKYSVDTRGAQTIVRHSNGDPEILRCLDGRYTERPTSTMSNQCVANFSQFQPSPLGSKRFDLSVRAKLDEERYKGLASDDGWYEIIRCEPPQIRLLASKNAWSNLPKRATVDWSAVESGPRAMEAENSEPSNEKKHSWKKIGLGVLAGGILLGAGCYFYSCSRPVQESDNGAQANRNSPLAALLRCFTAQESSTRSRVALPLLNACQPR